MHDMHAGFWKNSGKDAAEEDRCAEEGWDEGGDTLGSGADVSPEAEGAEKNSKNNGDGWHRPIKVARSRAGGKTESATESFVARRLEAG